MINAKLTIVLPAALLLSGCSKEPAASAPAASGQAASAESTTTRPSPPSTTAARDPLRPAPPPTPAAWEPSPDPTQARFVGFVAPKPATWMESRPQNAMRAANYTVPGRDGTNAAHVVVFYMGQGRGGSIEANITRWEEQFRPDEQNNPQEAFVETIEVDGLRVTLVEIEGDWMKMGVQWYTKDQLFLAAIVEAPIGNIFIRFAGDRDTVEANRNDFALMIRGLKLENRDVYLFPPRGDTTGGP